MIDTEPGGKSRQEDSFVKWYDYKDRRNKQDVWWTQRDANGVCWEIRHEPYSSTFKLYRCGSYVSSWGTLDEAMKAAR